LDTSYMYAKRKQNRREQPVNSLKSVCRACYLPA